ncbi:MAG: PSD1 and planctomycete cytochrome C domain-containing protein [Planctomycetota bacterium]
MRLSRLLLLFSGLLAPFGLPESSRAAEPDRFSREVAPILAKRCLECHSENEPSGKLVLSLKAAALQGGESGPAIVPRDVAKSQLLARVTAGEMPPPKRGHSQKLPDAEIKILRDWIASGAEWPDGRKLDLFESTSDVRAGRDWWSLQPVKKSRVPRVESQEPDGRQELRAESRVPDRQADGLSSLALDSRLSALRSPIDAFIIARLQAHQMEPAPPADRRTLIKRVSFDLVGLPPSFDDVEAFVNDPAPDAYERLVDRLLASPHFGERWARYWLDLVRYADTCGYERDQEKPGAWKYRDWVVRAINEDMPYARFVREQLAGDELPDRSEETLIATGFLRLGTWNDEPNDAEEYKYDRLEDLVGTTSTAFLGYTVKCARCHDHKFDPIQQADYYRMAAAFWPGAVEARGREFLGGPSREELDAVLGLPASAVSPSNKPLMPDILAWTDIRPAPPLHLLKKGEPKHPGPVVEPAAMSFVPGLSESRAESRESQKSGESRVESREPEKSGKHGKSSSLVSRLSSLDFPLALDSRLSALRSSRRTALAEWIAHPDNPLTARVLVNRLWTHHFGNGLVRSPDNFGFTGDKPTHPELLDWLSAELGAGSAERKTGTNEASSVPRSEFRAPHSLKRLHRLLVTSATYRQSSLHPQQDDYLSREAANKLWWHAERRRLDAESLRDRMLFVGESIDTRLTGPGFKPTIQAEALEGLSRKGDAWKPSPAQEQQRRSLYTFSQRSLLPPMMTTFDFGDTTLPCGQRPVSTVAPQALAMLNNAFAHERSTALATVVRSLRRQNVPSAERRDYGSDADQHVRLAWRYALGREPSPSELVAGREHLASQRRRFAHENKTERGVAGVESSSPRQIAPRTTGGGEDADPRHRLNVRDGLVLHLRADSGVKADADGRVLAWADQSGEQHSASQSEPARQPLFVSEAAHGRPALRFDGQRRFLHLYGQVLTSQSFAIFAVVTDRATTKSHREIFSNWNGAAGNAGTSLFLGMTGEDTVRLSDDFSGVGHVAKRAEPFLLSGFNGPSGAIVHQNDLALASKGSPLGPRTLTTAYVIGQQGNIDGEYWHGDLFELLVYNRDLSERDRLAVQRHLSEKYHLPRSNTSHDPDFLALASLCHVLLNTNEFAYVD